MRGQCAKLKEKKRVELECRALCGTLYHMMPGVFFISGTNYMLTFSCHPPLRFYPALQVSLPSTIIWDRDDNPSLLILGGGRPGR